jgi:hypothetical protein
MKLKSKFIIITILVYIFGITVFSQQDSVNKSPISHSGDEINYYLGLIKKGYCSDALYFNTGNAYFNVKDLPHAILYYEKALRISPLDPDIKYNLIAARRKMDSEIMPMPDFFLIRWWKNFTSIFSEDIWAIISLVSAFLMVVFTGYKWLKTPGFNVIWIWLMLCIFIIAMPASIYRNKMNFKELTGILMARENIYSAPDQRSEKLYNLAEGEKLKITDSLDKWYQVELINKEKGWIVKDNIEKI